MKRVPFLITAIALLLVLTLSVRDRSHAVEPYIVPTFIVHPITGYAVLQESFQDTDYSFCTHQIGSAAVLCVRKGKEVFENTWEAVVEILETREVPLPRKIADGE